MKRLATLFLLAALNLAAGEMVLVRDGAPEAEIILPEKPAASVQMAAFELNHHIKMITGTALPVKKQGEEPAPGKIRIELGGGEPPAGKEYTAIRFSPEKIRICGGDTEDFHEVVYGNRMSFPKGSTGTLFAVYDFLEKYCGVRWYGMTDEATAFVPRKTLSVEAKDYDHTPPTDAFRGFHNSGGRNQLLSVVDFTPRDEALLRLRWRCTSFFGQTNHNVYRIYFTYWNRAKNPKYAALFKERRENFFASGYKGRMAPLDGFLRREYPDDPDCPPGICFSEPGVTDFFAEQAVEQWNGLPMVGLPANGAYLKRLEGRPFFSSVQHQDTQGPCWCERCKARAKTEGQNQMMWQWIADIATKAAEKQPGIGISTLAYQRSLAFPEKVKLPDNLCVQMCLGIHAWWNPEFYRIQHDEIYRKWMDNRGGRIMTCWLYLFSPSWDSKTRYKHKFFPGVYPRHTAEIISEMVRDGIRGNFIECELARNMLECYTAMKIFYDPETDAGLLLDEYFTLFYGPAAPEMKEFFTELENIYWNWKNYPGSMFGKNGVAARLRQHSLGTGMLSAENNWSPGTPERMKKLSELIRAAEKKAAGSPLVLKRISWIRKGFWDQAEEGLQDHIRRMKVVKMPEKTLTVNRVANASGDPGKVDWSRAAEAGVCHTLEDGTEIPGAFTLRLAADEQYLYLEFLDEKEQKEPVLWKNFFEIFLSENGAMPIAQIALAPTTTHPLQYRNEMINDVSHVSSADLGIVFQSLENKARWHWRMAIPVKSIGSGDLRQFRMNFRRFSPDHKLVWNKFFASAADCVDNMGHVYLRETDGSAAPVSRDLSFREGRIRGEIGNWFLTAGTIRFSPKTGYADVRMKQKDFLVCTEILPVVPGEPVTVRWEAVGENPPKCVLQFFNGPRHCGTPGVKTVSLGENRYEMVLDKAPSNATGCRVAFSSAVPAEFQLGAIRFITGKEKTEK